MKVTCGLLVDWGPGGRFHRQEAVPLLRRRAGIFPSQGIGCKVIDSEGMVG